MQRGRGHAGLVQQADRLGRDQRSLFGGFCDDRIAGHQGGRDLPGKDGKRKIPWRDCDEYAAAAQQQDIALAGRSRHGFARMEPFFAFCGVEAAEIGRLANLRAVTATRLLAPRRSSSISAALSRIRARVLASVRLQLTNPSRAAATASLACSGVASMMAPTEIAGSIGLATARVAPVPILPSIRDVAATAVVSAATAECNPSSAARSPNSMPREFLRCG